MNSDLATFSQDPSAGPVLAALAEGKWRKARDAAKELYKKDKARYLPLLIEANSGLAREMIAKGLTKDAETVMAYLRTIAPKTVLDALEESLKMSRTAPVARTVDPSGNSSASFIILWPKILQVAENLAAGAQPTAADWAAVDAAVSSFIPAPTPENPIALELAAVHRACDATAEGRWQDAQTSLRALPRNSVFQHWRMFLRGVRHVFQGETEQAKICFVTLPKDGACARAAVVIGGRKLALGTTRRAPATARAHWCLSVTGQPSEWAAAIAEAEAAWKTGEWGNSYKALAQGLGASFPTDAPSLAGLLTDLLFISWAPKTPLEEKRFDRYQKFWPQLIRLAEQSHLTWKIAVTAMVLRDSPVLGNAVMRDYWQEIIRLETKFHGPNPVRDSIAWLWLAEQFAKEEDTFTMMMRSPRPRDPRGAQEAFQKAITADPENEPAHVALVSFLEKTGQKSERNKLLDDLVKRFPQNKSIMVQAGELAAGRKAFGKALTYLRAARDLDPLDKRTRQGLLAVLIKQAIEQAKKKKSLAAVWAEAETLLSDSNQNPGDLFLARWCMRVRQALLEPDPALQKSFAEDAARLAPSVFQRLALEELFQIENTLPGRAGQRKEWQDALREGDPGWADLMAVVGLIKQASSEANWSYKEISISNQILENLAKPVIKARLTSDPAGLCNYLDYINKHTPQEWQRLESILLNIQDWIHKALGPVAKNKKADPRLRFVHLHLTTTTIHFTPDQAFLSKLAAITKELSDAGFKHQAEKARILNDRLSREVAYLNQFDDDDDDDLDDLDDDDFLNAIDEPHRGHESKAGAPPPDAVAQMNALVQAMLAGDKKRIEKAKRDLIAAGCPAIYIDQILATMPPQPNNKHGGTSASQAEFELF